MAKTLSDDEQIRVRKALKDLQPKYPKQKDLASALGASQQHVSLVLGGGPVGPLFARRVANALGVSFEALIHGGTEPPPSGGYRLNSLPQWSRGLARAKDAFPYFPDRLWTDVGEVVVPYPPGQVSARWLANLALLVEELRDQKEHDLRVKQAILQDRNLAIIEKAGLHNMVRMLFEHLTILIEMHTEGNLPSGATGTEVEEFAKLIEPFINRSRELQEATVHVRPWSTTDSDEDLAPLDEATERLIEEMRTMIPKAHEMTFELERRVPGVKARWFQLRERDREGHAIEGRTKAVLEEFERIMRKK